MFEFNVKDFLVISGYCPSAELNKNKYSAPLLRALLH